ncbi:MAG: hypothetical protein JO016_04405 [Actinobacteria bacterium]|nr:hypothetical protein [Actinomycetota bacterium]
MRLIIHRNYEAPSRKDKYPSPYQFWARLELSDEEAKIVEQYHLEDHVLTQSQVSRDTIGSLIRGCHETASSLNLLMGNEQALRGACEDLPALFGYCRSFGENIVLEYSA